MVIIFSMANLKFWRKSENVHISCSRVDYFVKQKKFPAAYAGIEEVFMIEEMYVNRKAFPSWNFRLAIFELYLPNFRISLEKVGKEKTT